MPLSRLDNFLKNARGNILYVNPNDLDSTDSIENQGNSLARPFKTIQRALIEAARFSYQSGLDNDRFGKTTILLYPGEHVVDNRPGWIPDGTNNYRLRDGSTSNDFEAWSLTTNYDLSTDNNALYKLNSVHGGVILPRGTSIVGLDLRKTKIRPKYVPDPQNDNITASALFRVTGACYLWQFTMFDGDPNGVVYKDYTTNTFVPNYSHHKLRCFEYADGVNNVKINDNFITDFDAGRTDLEMYYEKVGLAYGPSSGREIQPDYPDSGLDIQPKIDEFRIVGPTSGDVGISSIKAGDGVTATTTITVTTESELIGIDVDTPIQISNITATGYSGQFVVSEKVSTTSFKYQVSNAPADALPSTTGGLVKLQTDTVTSASPYIFNISLRSVFGMCGLLADGRKATGFKSMVVAQFTGIGLQKDKNAFVKYDTSSGEYKDTTFAGNENINSDSRAVYKPSYKNFHIKCENDSILQLVSIFAIGYAEHFVADTGGDQSVTNSNSNFGAKALVSKGFKNNAFGRDDVGYITHIIPPREIETSDIAIEYTAIDIEKTVVGVASTSRLYLYNQTNQDVRPDGVIEGYRIGAKTNDQLNVLISDGSTTSEYSARIVMPNTELDDDKFTSIKTKAVGRSSAGINSISSNTISFATPHQFLNGETIRIISENGHLPDGLDQNTLYHAITSAVGLGTDEIKIARSFNEAINDSPITINNKGGILRVESRVSDKVPGDLGHPIQFDTTESQWYVTVGTAATDNNIYSTLVGLGTTALGAATSRTFIKRKADTRQFIDTIYRARYVIPAGSGITSARPPQEGYVIQESNDVTGNSDAEVASYFNPSSSTLSNLAEQRNFRFIANARWDSNTAYFLSELPHNLKVGSDVEVQKVTSANNPVGTANSGYNGTFTVTGITSAREFAVSIQSNVGPGTFTNDTSSRTTSLPTFKQKETSGTYIIYRAEEVREYAAGVQDGVYNLLLTNASNTPTVSPFSTERYSQNISYLYPQINRDNPISDAHRANSFAVSSPVGQVNIDEPQNSITKETIEQSLFDYNIGIGMTEIRSNSAGTAHTIFTTIDHGLNRVINVGIADSGAGYNSTAAGYLYNVKLVSAGAATTQGQNATARVQTNALGNLVSVKIMDGGSAYRIGESFQLVGVGTYSSVGIVTVTDIYDNIGDTVSLAGITPLSNKEFNTLYKITDITVGAATSIMVSSASTIGAASTLGVQSSDLTAATATVTGQTLDVTAMHYNNVTGVGIVTTAQAHGLAVNNKIKLTGSDHPFYNGDFLVKKINSQTKFEINVGTRTDTPAISGTQTVYQFGYASMGGSVTLEDENLGGRQRVQYAGITTTLSGAITSATTDSVDITNVDQLDINIGDFLQVGTELLRVKTTVSGSGAISCFRGALGTQATTHTNGAVVKKVRCRPIELRRNSIIRASGHTFEYVGYGPGNYSTALPDKQDRTLSGDEELLSQSTKRDGGVNVYTGMNDAGDFYIGNKKTSSATGSEEVFDAPIPSVTGEDVRSQAAKGINIGFDVLTPLEASISRSLRVEGGPDANIVSEFDGPVVFNGKVTSTSTKGMEAASLFLQGDATVSRKITIGVGTPSLAGNTGDIVFDATPSKGETAGWVYTTENDWYRFGNISMSKTLRLSVFDQVGIGTTTPGLNTLQVGAGSSLFAVDGNGVGIGTTANQYKLQVLGNVNVVGAVTATSFVGDGSALTGLANDSLFSAVSAGLGTGIFPIDSHRVGIGTTVPHFNLHLGQIGTGNTDLYVENNSTFNGRISAQDILVGGAITATTYRLDSTTSHIAAGIVTATNIVVGSSGTAIQTSAGFVGVGTAAPRAKLDIEGEAKFKTYSEYVEAVESSSNVVTLDLDIARTFTLTADEDVTSFTLLNPPSGATAFTIKILQDSTGGHTVSIDTFKDVGNNTISVLWNGGVTPTVTETASKTDIYSFMTFDGGSTLYGVTGGQNFS
tara:strand:+ start:3383 stop:9253 length:5871 start_codon:yes stop_codon:yes gene_type:complete